MKQDINYNDNNSQGKIREQKMTQKAVLSYRETIAQLAKAGLIKKSNSLVEPQLMKMREDDLRKRPYLVSAYVLEEVLSQFSVDYYPGKQAQEDYTAARKALEKILIAHIPKVFNTDKYYLYLGRKSELNIRGNLSEKEFAPEKINDIYKYLTEKYSSLNQEQFIYKIDLCPEVIENLLIVPLQYPEYRFVLGFLALGTTVPDQELIDKAGLLIPVLWNTLRDTFEIRFK